MRNLASIQKILKVEPIEGADRIEKATILGWQCVVKKDEFKEGDKCCYFEIDSMLPLVNPAFSFLKKKEGQEVARLKTIRLKKVLSQGLALPVQILGLSEADWVEGTDVTEKLGIYKYEPYIPAQLMGVVKGNFPSFVPKTDETRIQSYPEVLERHKNKPFYVTEKLDGSSCTVYQTETEFGVCSRNMDLKKDENNSFWKAVLAAGLDFKLYAMMAKQGMPKGVVVQGELVGMGIQGNKYQMSDIKLFIFNIYDMGRGCYLDYDLFKGFCAHYELLSVPIIAEGIPLKYSLDEILAYAKGSSELNVKTMREGLVWRPMVEEQDPDLGRLSFKTINNDFLEKYKDD